MMKTSTKNPTETKARRNERMKLYMRASRAKAKKAQWGVTCCRSIVGRLTIKDEKKTTKIKRKQKIDVEKAAQIFNDDSTNCFLNLTVSTPISSPIWSIT